MRLQVRIGKRIGTRILIQKRGVELDYNNLSRDVEKIKVFKDLQTLSN